MAQGKQVIIRKKSKERTRNFSTTSILAFLGFFFAVGLERN
jgi:hypothetical protein